MDICPHCGAPGSFADAADGRCPVCGMALLNEPEAVGKTVAPSTEPIAGTLQPTSAGSGERATIDFQPPDPDDTNTPRGIDLIKPRELSPEYARRVTAAWQNTRSQFIDPKETIKSEKPGLFETADLNIGAHVVAGVEEPGNKDYELKEVIGEGAMGTVWSARQSSLNRDVAIKMPKGSAKTEAGRRQFMSEVVVTGQLDHPNIVPIYDLGKDSSGELFYSMKRVEGRPWNDLLQNEELSLQENLEILMKVCDAIRFAHDRGVIHRDIKPHNIMVGQYGEVAVMDWGIALRLDTGSGLNAITRISPAGTPAYMAPEMATGSAGAIGPPTDVYLLGAVLYEVLTREPPHPPPFDSKNYNEILNDALLIAARNEIPPIKQGGELADIAYKALATDVENRYQSVREFQDAVREYYSHAESINLTERGEKLLARARSNGHATSNGTGRFDDFDRARFAFEDAIQIWPGNRTARKLQAEAILAYANYAYEEGAYSRGIALLSDSNPKHKDLLKKLKKARRRTNSLSFLLKAAVLLIVVGTSAFSFFLYRAWTETDNQRSAAVAASKEAERQRDLADRNAEEAKNNAEEAGKQRDLAKRNADEAEKNAKEAGEQRDLAERNAEIAKNNEALAKENEELAKASEAAAQEASYVSEIGLASEELQRNAFERARSILDQQAASPGKKGFRNWEWGYLKAQVSLDTKSFGENGGPLDERVESTAISKDQKWVVAGTSEGNVYVWQADKNEKPHKLTYGESVSAVGITADGSMVLAAGRSKDNRHAVKAWSLPLRKGAMPIDLVVRDARLLSLDLSQDSSTFLTSTEDGYVVKVPLDGDTEPIFFKATKQEKSIWSARFSPDGKWIVTAGEDGSVRIWNSELKADKDKIIRETQSFLGHEGPVYAAAFAPNGKYVVSGGSDRKLLAWAFDAEKVGDTFYSAKKAAEESLSEATNESKQSDAVLLGEHDAAVRSISFDSKGEVLFSGGHDHTVRVWNVAQGVEGLEPEKILRGHGGWVRTCMALPDQPQSVLSGGYDGRVQIWNWQNYSFPRELSQQSTQSLNQGKSPLTAGAVTFNGKWVATASASGVITIWDMNDPLKPQPFELAEGHDWQATTGIYFAEGRRLLTVGGDNTALVWDERRGNELIRIGGRDRDGYKEGAGWRGVAAVSSDGSMIATGAQGNILARIWNAESRDLMARIASSDSQLDVDGEKPEATALAFSPDGKTLLIGDQWGTCYIASRVGKSWRRASFTAHQGKISGIEFLSKTNNGLGFLTAGYDGTVQEWSLNGATAKPGATYLHNDAVVSMDLQIDGDTFITAAGSADNKAVLRVWDRRQSAEPIHALTLSQVFKDRAVTDQENLFVRSVSLHPSREQALVVVFDKEKSENKFQIAKWDWSGPQSSFEMLPGGERNDLSMALFAPRRGETAFLTVGGRGAKLQTVEGKAMTVSMSYRPQTMIHALSFSADGNKLLSASDDGTVKMWLLDPATGKWKPGYKLDGRHVKAVNSVAFHPADNDSFLSASEDGTAKLWRFRNDNWEVDRTLQHPDGGAVRDAAFVGDGIATVGEAGLFLWGAGETPRHVDGIQSAQRITPSPDGKLLVVASGSLAQVMDPATLTESARLEGHSANITSMAFTSNGSRLFTASSDNTVKLWDTSSMRDLLTLEGHDEEVTSVTAVADSENPLVLTTGLDGQAIIWPNKPVE